MKSFYQGFYKKKFCCIQLVSVFFISTLLTLTIGSPGYASSDAYDSGYDHGCDDAGITDPDDRYYNQPEKGPSFHTDAFNRGYNDGFDACSGSDNDNQPRRDSTHEPSNGCESIVGCYASGYEAGKEAGAEDWRAGRDHDSKCPPNDSLSFCTGYKVGYEVGWGAARTLPD